VTDEQKKFLFLKQVNMLDTLLSHGAISREQYGVSYNGLVVKMGVTDAELEQWTKK